MYFCRTFIYFIISFYLFYPRIAKSIDLEFLDDLEYCLKKQSIKKCNQIILEIESIQLVQEEKGNFKCQTSLLGLQTEIIRSIFLKESNDRFEGFSIPFVINNC